MEDRGKIQLPDYKRELGDRELQPGRGLAWKIAKADRKTKVNQLRKFLTKVQKVRRNISKGANVRTQVAKLYPMAAYAYARNLIGKPFYDFIEKSLSSVRSKDEFERFYEFLKAVIAYRKYFNETQQSRG